MSTTADNRWMRRALALAARHVGNTAPNPVVGCVIVRAGACVGEGAHERAGEPHAEVHALAQAGRRSRGATAYVTLEPCCHTGRTPPCVDALLAAKIKRVVVGTTDPNPTVSGRGIRKLRAAGVNVTVGVEQAKADQLINDFRIWTLQERPFVIYKVATTWDGATASADTGNEPITGPAMQRRVHNLRARCDAVLVGANTWRLDNPDLRARLANKGGGDPLRVVVARDLPEPGGHLLSREPASVVWICERTARDRRDAWREQGVTVIRAGGNLTPQRILARLRELGVHRLLLEGGATLAASFLKARLIDRMVWLHGNTLAGGQPDVAAFAGAPARPLPGTVRYHVDTLKQVEGEIWSEGRLDYGA